MAIDALDVFEPTGCWRSEAVRQSCHTGCLPTIGGGKRLQHADN